MYCIDVCGHGKYIDINLIEQLLGLFERTVSDIIVDNLGSWDGAGTSTLTHN